MIGLLEEDVCADAGILQLFIVFDCRGRDVHVDPSDRTMLMVSGIDGVDTLENVFDGRLDRMFARLQSQSLMAQVLKGYGLAAHFVLCELLARQLGVFGMIGAVDTAIHTIVGKIERCEKHDAITIEALLHLACQVVDALSDLWIVAEQEHSRLPVAQSLTERSFGDQ